jgi:acylphosphatase
MMQTKYLRIHGLVQGVGYRAAMAREASRLDVTGWVRNRADGSVESVVQGSANAVAAITAWAQRGPAGARVERIEIGEGEGVFPEFTMLPTR